MARVFSVTSATADTGKTTVAAELVACFARRGLRVAAVKHTRGHVEIDRPGSDTDRLSAAGARTVVISAPDRLVRIELPDEERGLSEILSSLDDHDVVVVEGYKRSPLPKVVVYRAAKGVAFPAGLENIIATVSDDAVAISDSVAAERRPPRFGFAEIERLADWLLGTPADSAGTAPAGPGG